MGVEMIIDKQKRITVVTGHFGSGKTEFAINYAMHLADKSDKQVAVVDLDLINMYFRIREQEKLLKGKGIEVHSTIFNVSSLDIPALDPAIEGVMRDRTKRVIIDVGGNPSGARALGRYKPTLDEMGYDQVFVINANRPESDTAEKVIAFIEATQAQSQTFVTGLINTTHLLKATTTETILEGQKLVDEVSRLTGIPVIATVARRSLVEELTKERPDLNIFPLDLYFRDQWML